MKKTIAMILMLVTILSLCACSAKTPGQSAEEGGQAQLETTQPETTQPEATQPEATQPETTQPEAPKVPNLDMFEGKWNIVDANFLDEITTFVINADGTMEANGETLTWTANKANPNSNCEMILEVNYPADPNFPNSSPAWAFDLRLARTPENTYVAEMRVSQMATTGDAFYREGDYEVIELNDDNAMEYLQQVPAENTFKMKDGNGFVNEYHVARKEVIKFKDGLGAMSFCSGNLIFEKTYMDIWLNDDATGFVEGDVAGTYVDEQGVFDTISVQYPREYTYTVSWFGKPGSADLEKPGMMECNRLISTKDVSGYVFIPV